MKGFSIPSISIPSVSLPKISISAGNINIDASTIKSAITSALPDLSSLTQGLNLEEAAQKLVMEGLSEGIELPAELGNLLK